MYVRTFSSPEQAALWQIKQLTVRLDDCTATIKRDLNAKYNPNQPRAPRGSSIGGQWVDSGGGRSSHGRVDTPARPQTAPMSKPPKKPRPAMTQQELARFNRNAPPGTPPEDLEIDPMFGLPRWYVGGGVSPTVSPFDFIGAPAKPLAAGVGAGARSVYNAYRLRRYLAEARQIPKGVKEVGKGVENLTSGQLQQLKEFGRARSKYKESIEVTNYSDGRAVFSVKQPARNIPNSYTVWEKQVDPLGNSIRNYKTTVGPDGELVHIKEYGRR